MKIASERMIFVYFGDEIHEQTHENIRLALQILADKPIKGITEILPGYTNICIHFNPLQIKKNTEEQQHMTSADIVMAFVQQRLAQSGATKRTSTRIVEIPVVYGGEHGPDLAYVAQKNGLTPEEVIDIHTAGDYLVYMLGFAPGFPFLGGLDKRLATPRRETPRLHIEAGSVGIAGEQTGVYPLATPGGWQIIGRTQLDLFLPHEQPPTLLRAGDRVKFIAVKEDAQ